MLSLIKNASNWRFLLIAVSVFVTVGVSALRWLHPISHERSFLKLRTRYELKIGRSKIKLQNCLLVNIVFGRKKTSFRNILVNLFK